MSWKIRKLHRELLEAETGSVFSGRGGNLRICLVYPESYHTGMSSLGFQAVYKLLNTLPGVVCDRAFLPDRSETGEYRESGSTLLSLETDTPLSDFDVIAFSVSFEPDYLNIPRILSLSRLPHFSKERSEMHPLIIGGGAAFRINPLPAAEFMDAICIGEAEQLLPAMIDIINMQGIDRGLLIDHLKAVPGVFSLSRHDFHASIPISLPSDVELHEPAASVLLTENTEFSNMFLMEVSRGCPRGCRFCTSGFAFGGFRQYPLTKLIETAEKGLELTSRIGLVGAAVSDHRDILALCRYIISKGASVSLSSLRVDRMDDDLLDILAASGQKTISIAPEGPSGRLRELVKKNITERQIVDSCERAVLHGILNLRLYFILGLPGESDSDLREMLQLVDTIRNRVTDAARGKGRLGEIMLSVNPFIPKPCTPLQWSPMLPLKELRRRLSWLERSIRTMPNVRIKCEHLEDSIVQAFISRGDMSVAEFLSLAAAEEKPLRKVLKKNGIDPERYAVMEMPLQEPLPWDPFCCSDRKHLLNEYMAARAISEQQ